MGNAAVGNNAKTVIGSTLVISGVQVDKRVTRGNDDCITLSAGSITEDKPSHNKNTRPDVSSKEKTYVNNNTKRENTENDRFSRPLPHRVDTMINEIIEDEELSDEHIDHAQGLLRQQFNVIGGFLSVSALTATHGRNLISAKSELVQIFHIPERHHWICVSNVKCDINNIMIYDSMLRKAPIVSFDLQEKMAAMLKSQSDIVLRWVDMKRQLNTVDCGVYAIAAATALCHGKLPEKCDWDPNKMRSHLGECFTNAKMKPFPVIGGVRHPSDCIKRRIQIHCRCNLPVNTKDRKTLVCSTCKLHFHNNCVTKEIDREFSCHKCKTKCRHK